MFYILNHDHIYYQYFLQYFIPWVYITYLTYPCSFRFANLIKDGPVDYDNYETFEADYIAAKIHPSELKPAVQAAINSILGMLGHISCL